MPAQRTLESQTRVAITWRKSSRSPSNGGNCVEAGTCSCHGVAIRDSKSPASGILTIHGSEWSALLSAIKDGDL